MGAIICSGNGKCVFEDDFGAVEECFIGDSCDAVCVCNDGYAGKGCDTLQEELTKAKEARTAILASFVKASSYDDESEDVVESRANIIASMASQTEELNDEGKDIVIDLIDSTLNSAIDSEMSASKVDSLVDVVSSLLENTASSSSTTTKTTSTTSSDGTSTQVVKETPEKIQKKI